MPELPADTLKKRIDALQALRDNCEKSGGWNVHLSLDVHLFELRALVEKVKELEIECDQRPLP